METLAVLDHANSEIDSVRMKVFPERDGNYSAMLIVMSRLIGVRMKVFPERDGNRGSPDPR